jgi:hypothetical protein
MTLKRIFPLLVAALLASCEETGCEGNPTPKTELEKLPPITQTGENTFGCLVNGKAWIPESSTDAVAIYQLGILQIGAGLINDDLGLSLFEHGSKLIEGEYKLGNNDSTEAYYYTSVSGKRCLFEREDIITGKMALRRLDTRNFIISGTFEFTSFTPSCDTLKITNGRFDLSLIL